MGVHMGETGSENRPARLPGNAPDALRQFVACTTDRVELDLDDMGWVPKPSGLPDAATPEVTVEDGWTPSGATIRVGWGLVSIGLPATIVDGQLRIDSTGLGFGIGDEIDPWVDAFNATLQANGKQLDTFDVTGGKVTMTKRAIPVGAAAPAAVATGGAAVAGTHPTEGPGDDPPKKRTGCLAWLIGAVVTVAAAIGLFLATTRGDENASESTGNSEPAASSSTSTSTTSTTSTTIAQVGQIPSDEETETQVACGLFVPPLGDVPDGDLDGYMLIGGNCEVDGSYLPTNFDDGDIPRSVGRDPVFFAAGSHPGWSHVQSQPDVFTGEVGPSFAFFDLFKRSWEDDSVITGFFSSDCGGALHSGLAAIQEDGTATVEHPLFDFGPCEVVDLGFIVELESGEQTAIYLPLEFFDDPVFDVGPEGLTAGLPDLEPYPQLVGPDSVGAGWSDSVQTIANVFGGTESQAPNCNSMVEPEAVVGGDALLLEGSPECLDRFWVFAAAQQSVDFELTVEDTVTGHFGTFVNPLGEVRPAIADTIDLAPITALFDGRDGTPDTAIFPCGFGHVALTVCPLGEEPMDTGAFVSVGIATGSPIPTEWDGTPRSYTVDFDVDSATALLDEAGWSVSTTSGAPVRALLRDNSLTFVLPQDAVDPIDETLDELAYKLRTSFDGKPTVQPAVPIVSLTTTPEGLVEIEADRTGVDEEIATPPASIETLDDFYSNLTASLSSGDGGFSLDRLAPVVSEAYPTQCPDAMERFADPELTITAIAEGLVEPWTWVLPDGRTYEVPNATEVTVVLTGRGQAGTESEAHLELINGQYHWFTLCE
jgi:hypothetical protein